MTKKRNEQHYVVEYNEQTLGLLFGETVSTFLFICKLIVLCKIENMAGFVLVFVWQLNTGRRLWMLGGLCPILPVDI